MFYNFQRIFSGINSCKYIQKSYPDKMSDQNNDDYLKEYRKLSGDCSFVCQRTESQSDEVWENRNNDS